VVRAEAVAVREWEAVIRPVVSKKSLSASFALFVILLHCIPYILLTIGLRLTLYNTSLPTLTEKTMSHVRRHDDEIV